jgi:hypothetical protein
MFCRSFFVLLSFLYGHSVGCPSNENEKPIKLDTEPAKDQQDIENETNDTEQKTEDNDEHGMLVN